MASYIGMDRKNKKIIKTRMEITKGFDD